ncbi:hypothetical protein [Anaerocellum diazotrophicum]|uniref:Lipoprotein n=1 Tax=Caldicellulosiruptor diazotrophicus TaxID=2806205 RepID=A0ABN6E8V9_9FIRM|nr:hypothetical protein [Caldicellulosiruptor diazotrophicus]BCS80554.1 lipoprotein [Caldicellulosiruptor diazotrophicus]
MEYEKKSLIILFCTLLLIPFSIYLTLFSPQELAYYKNGWITLWGGSKNDSFLDCEIDQASKTIFAAGSSFSNDKNLYHISKGNEDGIIVAYSLTGKFLWKKSFGGSYVDTFRRILLTKHQELFVLGISSSVDHDVKYLSKGNDDSFILKFKLKGNLQWQKCIGGSNFDCINDIVESKDTIVCVGYTFSNDGDFVNKNRGTADAFIVSLRKSDGHINWLNTFGGSSYDEYKKVLVTKDGYVVIGITGSQDKDMKGYSKGKWDGIIAKYSFDGKLNWIKVWGKDGSDYINDACITQTNEIVIAGCSEEIKSGSLDGFIALLDSKGKLKWSSYLRGSGEDVLLKVTEISKGKFIVGGISNSPDGNFKGRNFGNNDIILVSYDRQGNLIWINNIGGSNDEKFVSIEKYNNKILLCGVSNSNDYHLYRKNKGKNDILLALISEEGQLEKVETFGGENDEVLYAISISGSQIVMVGNSNSKKGIFRRISKGLSDAFLVCLLKF